MVLRSGKTGCGNFPNKPPERRCAEGASSNSVAMQLGQAAKGRCVGSHFLARLINFQYFLDVSTFNRAKSFFRASRSPAVIRHLSAPRNSKDMVVAQERSGPLPKSELLLCSCPPSHAPRRQSGGRITRTRRPRFRRTQGIGELKNLLFIQLAILMQFSHGAFGGKVAFRCWSELCVDHAGDIGDHGLNLTTISERSRSSFFLTSSDAFAINC